MKKQIDSEIGTAVMDIYARLKSGKRKANNADIIEMAADDMRSIIINLNMILHATNKELRSET